MNYRIETMTQHGKEISTFYALPQFSNQEKVILDTIGKSYFIPKQGTGMAIDLRCKFTSKYEIFIYKLGWETVDATIALDWANELYAELKADLEKAIENIYFLPFAVKCLQDETFSECKFNEYFIKIPAITNLRKMMDQNNQTLDAFLVPTVKDMNNIQVKIREDITDLQSNLAKVAANLDYVGKDLKERSLFLNDRIDHENQNQEILNDNFMTRLCEYDDWVETTLKPKLDLIDVLHTRVSELELRVYRVETPWYKKLWNKLTIFWSEM